MRRRVDVRRSVVDPGGITVLDQVADHAFRPDDQRGAGPGVPEQREECLEDALAVVLAAVLLADVGLDDADAGGVAWYGGGSGELLVA